MTATLEQVCFSLEWKGGEGRGEGERRREGRGGEGKERVGSGVRMVEERE